MKRRFFIPAAAVVLAFAAAFLSGCGETARQVPDAVIEQDAADCDYDRGGFRSSWTASHNYDGDSQSDRVLITRSMESDYGTMTCRRSAA